MLGLVRLTRREADLWFSRFLELVTQADIRLEQRVMTVERLVGTRSRSQRDPCAGQMVVVGADIDVRALAQEVIERRATGNARTALAGVVNEVDIERQVENEGRCDVVLKSCGERVVTVVRRIDVTEDV